VDPSGIGAGISGIGMRGSSSASDGSREASKPRGGEYGSTGISIPVKSSGAENGVGEKDAGTPTAAAGGAGGECGADGATGSAGTGVPMAGGAAENSSFASFAIACESDIGSGAGSDGAVGTRAPAADKPGVVAATAGN
jgi:hypothetical protein